MNLTDVIVIVVCLLIGYRFTSYFFSPGTGDTRKRQEQPSHHQRIGQDELEPPKPKWHEVLGVVETAGRDDIDRAYREKISQYSPEKVAQLGEDIRAIAEVRSREIQAAYEEAMRGRRLVTDKQTR